MAHRVRAGVTAVDGRGRHADFHSLRYTFCLWMSQHVPIEVVMRLMRHGSLHLTAGIYLDLGIDRQDGEAWVLPRILPRDRTRGEEGVA